MIREEGPNWPEQVLARACAEVGLDPAGARCIKFTNNAVFELSTAPVVVRIPGSLPVGARAEKVVAVAQWLAYHEMPTVRLLTDFEQPLRLGPHRVTFWHRVTDTNARPSGHDLGAILRRFHDLPSPSFDLPTWQPMTAIRRRVESEDVLSEDDHAFLLAKCDEVEEALGRIVYFLPPGPIHGDSFMGNLIPGPHGPVLCDFDSAAFGPREWDLTPVAVGRLRFTYTTDFHAQLAAAYGVDILDWPHFGTLRLLRELQLVTSVLPVLRTNPKLYAQWAHRFESFREGDLNAVWTTYS